MKVFISYSRKENPLAERLNAALNAAGFDTFLDTKELPPGQEFNARIKAAVDDSDVFVFLASQSSVSPGSYTLTELSFAEAKWRNPAGYVLPLVTNEFDPGHLPTYLRPINALKIRGNLEAEVVGWVEERATAVGGGVAGITTEDRFKKWARLSQPPIRKSPRRIPNTSIVMIIFGVIFSMFGFLMSIGMGSFGGGAFGRGATNATIVPFLIGLFGVSMIIRAVFNTIRVLRKEIKPVAVSVLNKEYRERGVIVVQLLTEDGKRLGLQADNRAASNVYPGEFGWAYVSGKLLLDFITGSPRSVSDS